ncbi:MAG: PQQ-binding-like beta-propeller repeat protein, partial [Planctomycetota bacterium]
MQAFRGKANHADRQLASHKLRFECLEHRLVLADVGLAGDWHTFGNGPSHAGYFAGHFGEEPEAALRWRAPLGTGLSQVSVADGRVYATRDSIGDRYAVALDEETGDELWRESFGQRDSISPPTFANGNVYFQREGYPTYLWSLDAETGLANWNVPHSAPWRLFFGPTVADGQVWVNGDDGMFGFDQATGDQLFFQELETYDAWAPSYHDGQIYTFVDGVFAEHHPTTGLVQSSTDLGWGYSGSLRDSTAAIADGTAYLIGSPGLYAIDLDTQAIRWQHDTLHHGRPAIAGDTVYALSEGVLHSYDAATGETKGTFATTADLIAQQPIVTDDAVIVRTQLATHIFARSSRAELLSIPEAGPLSLANDTLFISTPDSLAAYDLLLLPSLSFEGPATVTEGEGPLTWTVRVDDAPPSDLVIDLHSSDPGEATVPSAVTIAAGSHTATFSVTLADDADLEGPQRVDIVGSLAGYYDAEATMIVHDDETTTISLSAPTTVMEGDDTLSAAGTITFASPPVRDIAIDLVSSAPSELMVPATVTLLAGTTSADFDVLVVDDDEFDGPQIPSVTASVDGWTSVSVDVRVEDNETPFLALTIDEEVHEGSHTTPATVELPYLFEEAVTVHLASSDESELVPPASLVIPAGTRAMTFDVTVVDDLLLDSRQLATVNVSADGFDGAEAEVVVLDNETTILTVIAPTRVTEGDGTLTGAGMIQVTTAPSRDIEVNIQSSNFFKLNTPSTVTLEAGSTSASFDLSAYDNPWVEGPHLVTLTASYEGWTSGTTIVRVDDDEIPFLTLDLDAFTTEGNGMLEGRVEIPYAVEHDVTISLASDDHTELVPPPYVFLPAGATSVPFQLTIVDDALLDGTQIAQISASANGFSPASTTAGVYDNETTTLSVLLPASVTEGDGLLAGVGMISVPTTPTSDIVVALHSDDTSELVLPTTVTLPAGSRSATFDLSVIDDPDVDGPQRTRVTAFVGEWTDGVAELRVEDNESPFLTLTGVSEVDENAGELSLSVEVPYRFDADLTLLLESSDTSELMVPPLVTVPAGTRHADFRVTVVDDSLLDGSRFAMLTVSSVGFDGDQLYIAVHDNETTMLTAVLPTAVAEGDGVVSGQSRVMVETPPDEDVHVYLTSSHPSIQVPESVIIASGTVAAGFDLVVVDDRRADATQQVEVTAHVVNWGSTAHNLILTDNDFVGLSGDWHTYGNGPSHTGYFAGNLGPVPEAHLRWSVDFETDPNQVAIADGRVYV